MYIYLATDKPPYYKVLGFGYSVSDKEQISDKEKIRLVHENFHKEYPDKKVLDISTKSPDPDGLKLSPFYLKANYVGKSEECPVENMYQSSKVYYNAVRFSNLFGADVELVKQCKRLDNNNDVEKYRLQKPNNTEVSISFPVMPKDVFYKYLYMSAVMGDIEVRDSIMKYDAFSDFEFGGDNRADCAARAAAELVGRRRAGILNGVPDVLNLIMPYFNIIMSPEALDRRTTGIIQRTMAGEVITEEEQAVYDTYINEICRLARYGKNDEAVEYVKLLFRTVYRLLRCNYEEHMFELVNRIFFTTMHRYNSIPVSVRGGFAYPEAAKEISKYFMEPDGSVFEKLRGGNDFNAQRAISVALAYVELLQNGYAKGENIINNLIELFDYACSFYQFGVDTKRTGEYENASLLADAICIAVMGMYTGEDE